VSYGANHLVTTTWCAKIIEINKNPKFISSWENAPFDGPEDPQDGLNLDSKLREKFPRFTPDFAQYKGVYIELIAGDSFGFMNMYASLKLGIVAVLTDQYFFMQ